MFFAFINLTLSFRESGDGSRLRNSSDDFSNDEEAKVKVEQNNQRPNSPNSSLIPRSHSLNLSSDLIPRPLSLDSSSDLISRSLDSSSDLIPRSLSLDPPPQDLIPRSHTPSSPSDLIPRPISLDEDMSRAVSSADSLSQFTVLEAPYSSSMSSSTNLEIMTSSSHDMTSSCRDMIMTSSASSVREREIGELTMMTSENETMSTAENEMNQQRGSGNGRRRNRRNSVNDSSHQQQNSPQIESSQVPIYTDLVPT